MVIILSFGALSTFFKSKKSKSEEAAVEKPEMNESAPDFVKRSTLRKAEGLTPESIIKKRFSPTKFHEGYSPDEVDDFLDEVVAEFRRLQKEEADLRLATSSDRLPFAASPLITPEDVVSKRFGATKFRVGYDQDEVDDFLDEIVVALRRRTSANAEVRAGITKLIEETEETI